MHQKIIHEMPKLKKHYEPLPKEFKQSIFTLRLLERVDTENGSAAIYEKFQHNPDRTFLVCYEAIRIRKSDGGVVNFGGAKVTLEPKEIYPSDSKWGIDAYTTYPDSKGLEKARKYVEKFLTPQQNV